MKNTKQKRCFMKKIRLLAVILVLCLTCCALCCCVDKPEPKSLQELTLPSLKDNQTAVIVADGSGYTLYVVDIADLPQEAKFVSDLLLYLHDNFGLEYDLQGTFLQSVGELVPNADSHEYIAVYCNVPDYSNVMLGEVATSDGQVLCGASVGVTELPIVSNAVVLFDIATW